MGKDPRQIVRVSFDSIDEAIRNGVQPSALEILQNGREKYKWRIQVFVNHEYFWGLIAEDPTRLMYWLDHNE